MANILVAFFSKTGHTEQMAQSVRQGAEAAGADVDVRPVAEMQASMLLEYDGIILGSPTYYGQMAWEMKELLDESVKFHGKLEGKVGGAFASAGVLGGGAETTVLSLVNALLIHGMIVQGTSHGPHYGAVAIGAPDDDAAKACRALGERVACLAGKVTAQ